MLAAAAGTDRPEPDTAANALSLRLVRVERHFGHSTADLSDIDFTSFSKDWSHLAQ
jgi:hypothetical protein